MRADERESVPVPSALGSYAATLVVTVAVPVAVILLFDARLKWLLLGSVSWVLGLVAKPPLVSLAYWAVGRGQRLIQRPSVVSGVARPRPASLLESPSYCRPC